MPKVKPLYLDVHRVYERQDGYKTTDAFLRRIFEYDNVIFFSVLIAVFVGSVYVLYLSTGVK